MKVPRSHPRYISLSTREKLIKHFEKGIVAQAGLLAHGRGEAFDYLLGEQTIPAAMKAEKVAVASLLNANKPVISVNGNVAALAGGEIVKLAKIIPAKIEINLFYRTEDRVRRIARHLRKNGAKEVLGELPDAKIPNLDHARALCTKAGIFSADVLLVPLEDGDRTEALRAMGKFVIAIDLNPLSRTSRTANVTIVDDVTRALKNMVKYAKELKGNKKEIDDLIEGFDNQDNLGKILRYIGKRMGELAK